jgi:hypothetical protein
MANTTELVPLDAPAMRSELLDLADSFEALGRRAADAIAELSRTREHLELAASFAKGEDEADDEVERGAITWVWAGSLAEVVADCERQAKYLRADAERASKAPSRG